MKSNISEYDKYLHSLGVGTENITKDSEGIVYCEEYEKYLRTLGIGKGKESGEANKVDLKIKECPWRLMGVEHKGTINTVLQRKNADEKFELAVTYLLGTDGNLNEIVIDKNTRIQIRMANVYDCLIYPQVQDVLERQGGGVKWSTIQNDLARGVVKKHDVVFPVLWVLTINGIPFFDGLCGFSIYDKERELQAIVDKLKNSINVGENDVEYAIKWFLAAYKGYAVSIKGDCESKHRINCIQLYKPGFIDEPQEIDHIIVCPAGVVIIETKHWKGNIEIRADGKWIRKVEDEDNTIGVNSPKFQMRRHEALMQNILPGIQVHSLLCFSNASNIINGRENFTDYSIITIDQLEETLTSLCAKGSYTKEDIDQIVTTIEAHKLRRV